MLRPDSQPWTVSKPASQLRIRQSGFEAGYSFYIINIPYEILHWQFIVKNLETTVYTISFVINVANCSNDRRIGWQLWKQASTVLVQPVSESTNKLSRCYHFGVNQQVSKPSIQLVSKLCTLSQPVLKPSTLSQLVSKLSTQSVSKWSITFHWS